MTPVNIPELLDLAGQFTRRMPGRCTDFAAQCNRIHADLGRAGYHSPGLAIEASYLYAAMAEILNLCAAHKWHLGVAMAAHGAADRPRRDVEFIAEAQAMIGLAYGATVSTPEEVEAPLTFLAIGFRLLLDLCELRDLGPAEGIAAWYRWG